MDIKSLHHVAYRCKDAKQTAEFYTKVLGLEYAMAVAEDRVPSTGEQSPYMHIFFRMDDGSYVAFFELPESPEMAKQLSSVSEAMLDEWTRTKKAPHHADWVHKK